MVCHRHAHNNTTKTTAANLSCSSCSWKGHCLVVCHLLWNPCCAYTNAQATAARFSSYVTSCFLIWCVLLCQRWREERLPAQRPLRCSDAWGEYYSFPWLDLLVHRLCGMGIYAVATMLAAPALPYQHAAHLPSNQNAVKNPLYSLLPARLQDQWPYHLSSHIVHSSVIILTSVSWWNQIYLRLEVFCATGIGVTPYGCQPHVFLDDIIFRDS